MRTNRRDFIKVSAGGAAALSVASTGAWLSGCTSSQAATGMRFLRPEDVEMLKALTPAILSGQINATDTDKIQGVVESFDQLLGTTSQIVVDLMLQAFDALNFMPSRGLMTGQWSAWSNASLADANNALARLRNSNISLLNAVYAATTRLVISSYYLRPENQRSTGYPGPPKKVSGSVPAVEAPEPGEETP
ncbi:MAG: twin-arginine translocation signal domain-containing protein [Myxococcota bacterium]